MMMTSTKSLLEEYSSQFNLINYNIYDFPEEHYFTFQPAGFTKVDSTGKNRQNILKNIYETAVNLETETAIYPLTKLTNYEIELISDKYNKYDENAIMVILSIKNNLSTKSYNLGFIPRIISRVVKKNINKIAKVEIYKVHSNIHEKYNQVTIAVSYDSKKSNLNNKKYVKFMDMLE